MLVRSSSSRRHRDSRTSPSTSQTLNTGTKNKENLVGSTSKLGTPEIFHPDETVRSRSRRASAASFGSGHIPLLVSNKSPRNSIAIPPGSEASLLSLTTCPSRTSRGGFVASDNDKDIQSELCNTFARESFVEGLPKTFLAPEKSLGSKSARNSFSISEIYNYSADARSGRNSFDVTETSTDLLLPPQGTRSARGSFSCPNSEIHIPVPGSRSARASFSVPNDNQESLPSLSRGSRSIDRTPRGSLVPPDAVPGLSPHGSLISEGFRSPRGSIVSDIIPTRSSRNSVVLENFNRSARGSISSEVNKSPRGSITVEFGKSVKNGFDQDPRNRRGSSGTDGMPLRSSKTSPRSSIPDTLCSPRSSLAAANLQISPRGSIDNSLSGSTKGMGMTTTGSYRLATRGPGHGDSESRRASSSVSQISADDRRQLCEHAKLNTEPSTGLQVYGSVVFQLKDANVEASGTCDFVLRALRVVFKTVSVTIILVCLSSLPIIMLIIGLNYLRDCPREPHLPIYMIVEGSFGAIEMLWIIWKQIKSRRYQKLEVVPPRPSSNFEEAMLTARAGSRAAFFALSLFLMVWFVLGNYWTFRIYLPDFEPELYEPNKWCSKTLYIFSLVHLGVIYLVVTALVILSIVFVCCHKFACPLVVRYK